MPEQTDSYRGYAIDRVEGSGYWRTFSPDLGGTLIADTRSGLEESIRDKLAERNGLDFDATYSVAGHRGIAFRLLGWAREWEQAWESYEDENGEWEEQTGEGEWVEDRTRVRAVMVGDDREWEVDVSDLTVLSDEEYCGGCGQIGCGHG